MKKLFIGLFFIAISMLTAMPSFAKNSLAVWAYSDEKGNISLFWFPDKQWPLGGWRIYKIQNGKRTVLRNSFMPADNKQALNSLSPGDRKSILMFRKKLKSPHMGITERKAASFIFAAAAMKDINFGKAVALRFTDSSKTKGARRYEVAALSKRGKIIEKAFSIKINPYKASPPVAPVSLLEVKTTFEGVALRWKKPYMNKHNPVIGYKIYRIDPDGSKAFVTKNTLIVSDSVFAKKAWIITDTNAPLEAEVTYRIYSVGLFNNLSLPFEKRVYIEDLSALMPPEIFYAKAGEESIKLFWKKNKSPNCAGYALERSFLYKGPFVVITPKGITADKNEYTDKNLQAGTNYFYRIRTVNIKGKLGNPSVVVKAQPISNKRPPKIKNLKADVGRFRITLTWGMPKVPVSGFMVYRKAQNARKWVMLNVRAIRGNRYTDAYSDKTYGTFLYRVSAVGYDNKEGEPSDAIKVRLLDYIPPNPPYITDIDGSNGKVTIYFKPSPPVSDVKSLYLIRSVSEKDPGLVIGDAIDPSKRKTVDKFVKLGKRYWYRMVAVDKHGNRSYLSKPVTVVVQSPPIPTPSSPTLTYKQKPTPHVVIKLSKIPKRLIAIIQKKQNGNWVYVAATSDLTPLIDLNIQKGSTIYYRVLYKNEVGLKSKPSKASYINTQ